MTKEDLEAIAEVIVRHDSWLLQMKSIELLIPARALFAH